MLMLLYGARKETMIGLWLLACVAVFIHIPAVKAIQKQPPSIPRGWHELEVEEGSRVAMTCESGFHPVASWKTNHLNHDSPCREHIELINTEHSSKEAMIIHNFTRDCLNWYRCVAKEDDMHDDRGGTPVVAIVSENQDTIVTGENITVTCNTSALMSSTPVWMKDGIPLRESQKHSMRQEDSTAFLAIKNVEISDEGIYTCLVENRTHARSGSAVLSGVIRFQVTPQEVEIVYKQPITVRCELETSLHLHFMWLVEDNIFHGIFNNSYVTVINTVTHGKHIMEAKYREFQRDGVEVIGCYIHIGDVYLKREILVKYRFYITPVPKNLQYVAIGGDATLTCEVYSQDSGISSSYGNYQVDLPHINNTAITVQSIDNNTALIQMTVWNMTSDNAGTFECVASNYFGETKRKTIKLSVGTAPNIVISSPVVYEEPGGEITLECFYEDHDRPHPYAHILWKKGVAKVPRKPEGFNYFKETDYDYLMVTDGLLVVNVTKELLGTYTCLARNQFGWSYQHVTLKGIPGKPPMVETTFYVRDNDHVVFVCTMYCRSNVSSLLWYKGKTLLSATKTRRRKYTFTELSSTIQEGYHLSFYFEKTYMQFKGKLIMRKCTPDDFNMYTCLGRNDFGNSSATFNITENYGPPQILYHRNNQILEASVGQRICLNCEVKYFFMYAIKWRKNEEYIESNGHYVLHSEKARRPTYSNIKFKVTNWFLDIPNLDEEDFGNYTCEATNRFGEDAVTFTVVKQAT